MIRRMMTTVSLFQPLLNDIAILLLRVTFGGLLLVHGWGKVTDFNKLTQPGPEAFADPLGIGITMSLVGAIIGEVVGSALVMLGCCTRVGALLMAFTMGVAAFIVHGSHPLAKKEMALLYLAATLAVALFGGGRFSVDRLIWKKS